VKLAVQGAADEAAARSLLTANGVPLGHVHSFQIEHGDIWARDTGPNSLGASQGSYEYPRSTHTILEKAATLHWPAIGV
jgi:agmatine/peptidylarginine deiminase